MVKNFGLFSADRCFSTLFGTPLMRCKCELVLKDRRSPTLRDSRLFDWDWWGKERRVEGNEKRDKTRGGGRRRRGGTTAAGDLLQSWCKPACYQAKTKPSKQFLNHLLPLIFAKTILPISTFSSSANFLKVDTKRTGMEQIENDR